MWIKLQQFEQTDIMTSVSDAYFDADYVQTDGLMFAFGVTAYDDNPEPIEDPTIGVLKPYYKSWGLDETIGGIDFELLPTRNCSEAELHINNQTSVSDNLGDSEQIQYCCFLNPKAIECLAEQ